MEKISKWHRDYCCVIGAHHLIFLPLLLIITLPPPQIICHTVRGKSGSKMSTSSPHPNLIGVYTNPQSRHDCRGKLNQYLYLYECLLSQVPQPLCDHHPCWPGGQARARHQEDEGERPGGAPERDQALVPPVQPRVQSLMSVIKIEYDDLHPYPSFWVVYIFVVNTIIEIMKSGGRRWGVIFLTIHHHYFLSHEFLKNSW